MIIKVTKKVYDEMINCPEIPPETGGILGSSDGKIIDCVIKDKGRSRNNKAIYIPNTEFFNKCLSEWEEKGIKFRGIFHTHLKVWPQLSNDDITYIRRIVNSMPSEKENYFFPIVFPGEKIKSYIAGKKKGCFFIVEDNVEKCFETY